MRTHEAEGLATRGESFVQAAKSATFRKWPSKERDEPLVVCICCVQWWPGYILMWFSQMWSFRVHLVHTAGFPPWRWDEKLCNTFSSGMLPYYWVSRIVSVLISLGICRPLYYLKVSASHYRCRVTNNRRNQPTILQVINQVPSSQLSLAAVNPIHTLSLDLFVHW